MKGPRSRHEARFGETRTASDREVLVEGVRCIPRSAGKGTRDSKIVEAAH